MRISFQNKVQLLTIGLLFFMICLGCAPSVIKPAETVPAPPPVETLATPPPAGTVPAPPVETPPPQKITYYVHTVRWPGETVSIIAGWYTGDIENWEALAEANPDINPDRIFKGNKILIPENLMKTRDPMPKEHVDNFYRKKPLSRPLPSQPREEEPKLFGPKYPKK